MGLAKRIIPCLLKRGANLVKGKQFSGDRVVGHAMQACKIYAARGADEIVLLDIGATREGRGPDLEAIRELSQDFFTPLAVGGGIRTIEQMEDLFSAGSDKIVVNTLLAQALEVVHEASGHFGCQAIIASIDYSMVNQDDWTAPRHCVSVENGRTALCVVLHDAHSPKDAVPQDPVEFALRCANAGAGEILLTSIDREGMMEGMDLEMIEEVSKAVDIPVIAHGGCGSYEHAYEAIQAGASAVGVGSLFQFTDLTPRGMALYLQAKGIEVRIP